MPRPGNATQRGYGTPHRKLRARLLAQFTPGQPCPKCGKPIWNPALAHLGHSPDRLSYTGLEHARCNTADGARRGNRARGLLAMVTASRRW